MSVCVDIKKSMHVDILVIDIYVDIFYLPKTFSVQTNISESSPRP